MIIARAGPDGGIQARHSFQIMVVYIRPGLHDHLHRPVHLVAEIGGEDFDGGGRRLPAQLLDHLHELAGAAIGQVIPVNRGDDDMFQPKFCRRFRDMARLGGVHRVRHPGLDVAEGAGAGAGITQDHHRGVLLAPAFADIGAGRLLTYGVEFQAAHQRAGFGIGAAGRRLYANPVRLARQTRGIETKNSIVHPRLIAAGALPNNRSVLQASHAGVWHERRPPANWPVPTCQPTSADQGWCGSDDWCSTIRTLPSSQCLKTKLLLTKIWLSSAPMKCTLHCVMARSPCRI